MKKLLITTLLLCLTNCTTKLEPQPQSPTLSVNPVPVPENPTWQIVKEYNIFFSVPSNWYQEGDVFVSPDNKAAAKHVVEPNNGFDEYVTEIGFALSEKFIVTQLLTRQEYEGRPAAMWMCSSKNTIIQVLAVEDGNTIHNMVCSATVDMGFQTCSEIINSLRFQ